MKLRDILSDEEINVIAVDFDGCLCEDEYPSIGDLNMKLIDLLKHAQINGKKIILNTCRSGVYLDRAVFACQCAGLLFNAINENLPERVKKYGNDCRKVSADIYIDDRAFRVAAKAVKHGTKI